jgi:uncharacterized protein YggE
MSRRRLSPAAAAAAFTLAVATPALADTAKTITATGTAAVKVVPTNRNSESSIRTAVEAAEKAGVAGAMRQAREYALRYASASGMTLGGVLSVTDAPNGRYLGFGGPFGGGFGGPFGGPFGPNQFCGTERRPVFKRSGPKHRQKLSGFKNAHVCYVPRFAATTLTVTYSAT